MHRTRTGLCKWFLAAYLMGRDKRGVSGQVSATGAGGRLSDGLDHGAQAAPRAEREDPSRPLHGLLRGGRDLHRRPGRSDKSRTQHGQPRQRAWSSPPSRRRRRRRTRRKTRARRQASARVLCRATPGSPMLPAATGAELGAFTIKANVETRVAPSWTDGFAGYRGRDAALGERRSTPHVDPQDEGANAGEFFPIIHTLFSNIKASARRHPSRRQRQAPPALPSGVVLYRFNRRNLPDGLDGYLIRRARVEMRHHHLRPTHRRHHAERRQPHPPTSCYSCTTCSSWIGRTRGSRQ